MKLGLSVGYWTRRPAPGTLETILEAERLGYDSVWTAEAYGSDALTPLAWWGARTSTIKLGTAIMQLSARAPTATAMAAMSLDHLSGGRFIAGLGVSGPQVVEGWYGQPFARPLARTREYISIMRQVLERETPVRSAGPHYPLPRVEGDGVVGLGKALKPSIHPLRRKLPIYLAAEGPKNIALAGELCEGWLALFYSPDQDQWYRRALGEVSPDFEVAATVPLVFGDVDAAADTLRPMYALYFGGMGAKAANFHAEVAIRMGYEEEVRRVQALYLEGRKNEAAAAVPLALIDSLALIGPVDRVRDRLAAWESSLVTTLLIAGSPETLRTAAELALS
jgi:F420-dependent oxidoreductase-like protein